MEMSQGNSLCSYLKPTKMSFFSFTKLENRRAEQVLPMGLVPVGGGKMWEMAWEGGYSANTVYTCI
jgi:hypothetical protein